MGDLCSCWDPMNNMLVWQQTVIKALFQKITSVIEHKFNTLVYKNLSGFVLREAQDMIFYELQQVNTIGTDSSACGCTLRVTHGLPCACELTEFISIYGYIPLKRTHVHWKMLSICSSYNTDDSWADLTLTHEVDALFKIFSQLRVYGKITLKTKVHELAFLDITLMCPPTTKIKNNGCTKVREIYRV